MRKPKITRKIVHQDIKLYFGLNVTDAKENHLEVFITFLDVDMK